MPQVISLLPILNMKKGVSSLVTIILIGALISPSQNHPLFTGALQTSPNYFIQKTRHTRTALTEKNLHREENEVQTEEAAGSSPESHTNSFEQTAEEVTHEEQGSTTSHTAASSESHHESAAHSAEEEESEPPYAILFPWFANLIGVIVFYLLTRFAHFLPYTAVMFVAGIFMGVGVTRGGLKDQLTSSIDMWSNINAEVLLLVFLPGLLFRDAFDVNFHLFCKSFGQLLLMAFPMVLAGTALTALIGLYIFPYGWSFNLSMTFGSIMAATDPVAVAALMNEVGAPPRLKMHIGGEAMLNDGSAMVFFTIFSKLFLYDMGIPGIGMDVDVGKGFEIFFRMALGGAVIGSLFGFALIGILYLLNRRLEMEENVLQVTATATIAYLSYYTSEMVLHMSGVIAVVFCGICTRAFAGGMINDTEMMESFWILVEHLLNTVLFALAGVMWGTIISDKEALFQFGAADWGYLFILYILVVIIRFVLIGGFYPLISRIGLKSSWQEAFFASWGGLRGAVGIALAISLNSETLHLVQHSGAPEENGSQTVQLFAMVGGIAFITLIINGTLSGPLLRKLGLVKSTVTRKRIVESFHEATKRHVLDDFVNLLADSRFRDVDFAVVRYHVPILEDITAADLRNSLRRYKETNAQSGLRLVNLANVAPYLEGMKDLAEKNKSRYEAAKKKESANAIDMSEFEWDGEVNEELVQAIRKIQRFWRYRMSGDSANANKMFGGSKLSNMAKQATRAVELRRIYIELLRMSYENQIESGELDAREGGGFVVYVLKQSLEFAYDEINRGSPLQDWEKTQMVKSNMTEGIKKKIGGLFKRRGKKDGNLGPTNEYSVLRTKVTTAIGFIKAHRSAQKQFRKEFASADFGEANDIVIRESEEQVKLAEDVLKSDGVEGIVSRLLCSILLNKEAHHIEHLTNHGLLMQREAAHFIEEITESVDHLRSCTLEVYPSQLSENEKRMSISFGKHLSADMLV